MPAMIKLVRDRAEVTDEFKRAIKYIFKSSFKSNKEAIEFAPSYARKAVTDVKTPILRNLARVCTYDDAFDGVITRLRALPFARYDVTTLYDEPWLKVTTKPITAEGDFYTTVHHRGHRHAERIADIQKWLLGPYTIYVKIADFTNHNINNFHMVPDLDPTIRARHMHHRLDRKYLDSDRFGYGTTLELHTVDYLAETPHTCWGSFPNLVTQAEDDGDIVEFLRILHIYLSRLDPHSPLQSITDLTFAQRIMA